MESNKSSIKQRLVYLDHDGAPEDVTCIMLVLGMKNTELIGMTYTQGDSSSKQALEVTLKILSLYESKIEMVMGEYISSYQFPEEYKIASIQVNNLPILINQYMDKSKLSNLPAGEFMAKKIKEAPQKVTVLVTGPLSHVARALEYDPTIKENIEELVFMGGAVDVKGNVYNVDRTVKPAEWNVYWDIPAAMKVFESGIPITMFPLDATNQVPVTKKTLSEIAKYRSYNILDIVGQFYAICYNGDWTEHDNYFFWDTLCTSYLGCEGMAEFEMIEIEILPLGHESQGKTARKPGCGRWVKVPIKVDKEKFFQFFIETLKRNGKIQPVYQE